MVSQTENSVTAAATELVVLLDSLGNPIGTADKYRVHTAQTPLHSAFSVFLFNHQGQMLAQQRAWSKQTWPGIWSNACCGHPLPGETIKSAAERRLRYELGLSGLNLQLALPSFRYRAKYRGIVENEICPVFVAMCDTNPSMNSHEVADFRWIDWTDFKQSADDPNDHTYANFSPWSLMEAQQLNKLAVFERLFDHLIR